MQEALWGSVVMVTTEALSNLAFARANWAEPKLVSRVTQGYHQHHCQQLANTRNYLGPCSNADCRNCPSLELMLCSFLLSKTETSSTQTNTGTRSTFTLLCLCQYWIKELNGWVVWMAVPASERWRLSPFFQTICLLCLKLSLCIL